MIRLLTCLLDMTLDAREEPLTTEGALGDPLHAVQLEGVEELPARVFRDFLQAVRLHRRLMIRTMAEHGTHPGQAMCLRVLEGSDGITQRDLADALQLARPTVSKMLRVMEQSGLVERRSDARDQRLVRVYLTAAGRDLAQELRAVAAAHINRTIGSLPERDLEELARLLEELSGRISRVLAGRPSDEAADVGEAE
jgi:MarR family transcriptional regulator, organic hydroperoxide resistance regulator